MIVLKDGPPWGFRMTGGKNTGSPLKISRVYIIFDFTLLSLVYNYGGKTVVKFRKFII